MHLEIITPDKKLFEGEATAASFPGSNGAFQVLNNHAAIISSLEKGELKVKTDAGNEESFVIDGGVVEVLDNKIVVLAEGVIEEEA